MVNNTDRLTTHMKKKTINAIITGKLIDWTRTRVDNAYLIEIIDRMF